MTLGRVVFAFVVVTGVASVTIAGPSTPCAEFMRAFHAVFGAWPVILLPAPVHLLVPPMLTSTAVVAGLAIEQGTKRTNHGDTE